jgi:hypothetical protein
MDRRRATSAFLSEPVTEAVIIAIDGIECGRAMAEIRRPIARTRWQRAFAAT